MASARSLFAKFESTPEARKKIREAVIKVMTAKDEWQCVFCGATNAQDAARCCKCTARASTARPEPEYTPAVLLIGDIVRHLDLGTLAEIVDIDESEEYTLLLEYKGQVGGRGRAKREDVVFVNREHDWHGIGGEAAAVLYECTKCQGTKLTICGKTEGEEPGPCDRAEQLRKKWAKEGIPDIQFQPMAKTEAETLPKLKRGIHLDEDTFATVDEIQMWRAAYSAEARPAEIRDALRRCEGIGEGRFGTLTMADQEAVALVRKELARHLHRTASETRSARVIELEEAILRAVDTTPPGDARNALFKLAVEQLRIKDADVPRCHICKTTTAEHATECSAMGMPKRREVVSRDYSWIKVKSYIDDPTKTWEERYAALEKHHEAETKFLIAEIEKVENPSWRKDRDIAHEEMRRLVREAPPCGACGAREYRMPYFVTGKARWACLDGRACLDRQKQQVVDRIADNTRVKFKDGEKAGLKGYVRDNVQGESRVQVDGDEYSAWYPNSILERCTE